MTLDALRKAGQFRPTAQLELIRRFNVGQVDVVVLQVLVDHLGRRRKASHPAERKNGKKTTIIIIREHGENVILFCATLFYFGDFTTWFLFWPRIANKNETENFYPPNSLPIVVAARFPSVIRPSSRHLVKQEKSPGPLLFPS